MGAGRGPWAVVLVLLAACGSSHERGADASAEDAASPVDAGDRRPDAGPPDAGLPPRCSEGVAVACDCPAGASGYRYCGAGDPWGPCECPVPPVDAGAPPDGGSSPDGGPSADGGGDCTPTPELCDGLDNDCDGVVDDGWPCPDSSVRYTLPYDGAVWLMGYHSEGIHGYGVQRVWPTVGDREYRLPLPTYGQHMLFRDDAELFFQYRKGIGRYERSGELVDVPTPYCDRRIGSFGFDAAHRLFYTCSGDLMRDGEVLRSDDRFRIVAVLSSGKLVVGQEGLSAWFLLDDDGTELSSLDLSDWGPVRRAVHPTVQGDSAFVGFQRTYLGGTRREVVVYRVDGSTAEWRRVRRVPVESSGIFYYVALPDGRLIELLSAEVVDYYRIREYPLRGPPFVVAEHGRDRRDGQMALPLPRAGGRGAVTADPTPGGEVDPGGKR